MISNYILADTHWLPLDPWPPLNIRRLPVTWVLMTSDLSLNWPLPVYQCSVMASLMDDDFRNPGLQIMTFDLDLSFTKLISVPKWKRNLVLFRFSQKHNLHFFTLSFIYFSRFKWEFWWISLIILFVILHWFAFAKYYWN